MRGQAEQIGGTIEIDSKPGSGTRVVAVLPVGGRGEEG
jgi:signal transduction histidine kinase